MSYVEHMINNGAQAESDYLTALEAAQLLGISRFYVAKLAREGRIPVQHKGTGRTGAYVFSRRELEAHRAKGAA